MPVNGSVRIRPTACGWTSGDRTITRKPRNFSPMTGRHSIVSDWRVPLSDISFGDEETSAVQDVLRSGWLSMGPEVEAFEREFAEALGTKHAVAVSNGTVAIHLAMAALELEPRTEIIQPALNFVAAANTTVALGSIPVFADILGYGEPTIDPADI